MVSTIFYVRTYCAIADQYRYKNEAGLITNNWSGTVVDYQNLLAEVNWNDYIVDGSGKKILEGEKATKIGRVVEETQVSDTTITILTLASAAVIGAGWLAQNPRYLSSLRIR